MSRKPPLIEHVHLDWPPLISSARVPGWVRLRDLLLTIAAWGVLFYLMSDTLRLVNDYLRPPAFQFSSLEPPNWRELWGRLRPFFLYVAPLVLWLLFWALKRGRIMRATAPVAQPVPLALATHAAGFGLEEAAIAPWREARCLVVHFDAAGRISHGEVTPLD
jgi:poly-beta-1,6-N-acetyl-D-glucosamine biosynthesis protein PgaD